MATGVSTAQANSALDSLFPNTGRFVQLHTADPGAAGTTAVSSVATRQSIARNSAGSGSKALSASPQWTSWAGTNGEVVTHISEWTASSGGTFIQSLRLEVSGVPAPRTMNTGDTLILNTMTDTVTPLAA